MATSSFLNDNLYRSYPFVSTVESKRLPMRRIVGAKVQCSFGSPFEEFPTVRLTDWTVRSTTHSLTFLCSDGSAEISLPVTFSTSIAPFEQVDSPVIGETRIRLTVGNVAKETESFTGLDLCLEPTCLLWLRHRGVRQIQIGNENRNRLSSCLFPGISSQLKKAYTQTNWWIQEQIITSGPIVFREGFNCSIFASTIDGKIRFQAAPDAGLGASSEFVSLGKAKVEGRLIDEIPGNLPDSVIVRPDGLPRSDRILYAFCGATGSEIHAGSSEFVQMRNDVDMSTVNVLVTGLDGKGC